MPAPAVVERHDIVEQIGLRKLTDLGASVEPKLVWHIPIIRDNPCKFKLHYCVSGHEVGTKGHAP